MDLIARALTPSEWRQFSFDFSACLSLIEQKDVRLSDLHRSGETKGPLDALEAFEEKEDLLRNRKVGPSIVGRDIYGAEQREQAVESLVRAAGDPSNPAFRKSLFRCVETLRLEINYADITYYLFFSALELLARSVLADRVSNAPEVLARFLRDELQFNVHQNGGELIRATDSYCQVRNALVHNGELEKVVDVNGASVSYDLIEHLTRLKTLAPLALLRFSGFNHAGIDWDQWCPPSG